MNNKKYFFLNLVLILFVVSCGRVEPRGKIKEKKKTTTEYSKIKLHGKFRAFFVKSDSNFVNIETYRNVARNLKINVADETLSIAEKRPTGFVDFYSVTIYSKNYPTELSISDSVEFNVSGEINTENFRLNLSDNGKFIGAIRTKKAEVEMQHTSLANLKGFTKNARIKISDTANILAPYWMVDDLHIAAKNRTYSEVNVKDSLKGNVNDTAKLLYYNDPIRAFKIDKTATVNNKKLD